MERLTSRGRNWRTWAVHLVLLGVVVSGPTWFSTMMSGLTSLITFPLTGRINATANLFEIFNSELLLIYLIAVIGVNLVAQAGLLTVGQSAIFAIGAYTVAITTTRHLLSFWEALLMATVLSSLVGLILGFPSLRLGVFTLAMITVGYAYVSNDLINDQKRLTGGFDGLSGIVMPAPFDDITKYYWVVAAATVAAYVVGRNLLRSPMGRAAKAVEQNSVAAQSLGIDLYRTKLAAFAVSSAFAGVAGALYAPLLGFISADSFTINLSILLLLMALLGGGGSVGGPILGTILLFRIPIEVARVTNQSGDWSLLVYAAVLLASVYLFPQGVMSGWWWIVDRASRSRRRDRPIRSRPDVQDVITPQPTDGRALIDARGVSKSLGGVQALSDVHLTLAPGTVHALIGPNGSGKTTFLNTVCGFIRESGGDLLIFDNRAHSARPHARAKAGLGRTFQTSLVFGAISCLDNVMVAMDIHRKSRPWSYALRLPWAAAEEARNRTRAVALLQAVGIGHRLDERASNLPPGERRLLEVARVLATNPRAILMDEPAAGLSGAEIEELEHLIRQLRAAGIGVLLVEHHIEFVMRLADAVTVIDFGRTIAHGSPTQTQKDPVVIAAYLGQPEEHLTQEEERLLSEGEAVS